MSVENKPPLLTIINSFLASNDEVLSVYGNFQRFSVDFDSQHLITWFQQFRRGIVYVYDRFGTIANDIKIAENATQEIKQRLRVLVQAYQLFFQDY